MDNFNLLKIIPNLKGFYKSKGYCFYFYDNSFSIVKSGNYFNFCLYKDNLIAINNKNDLVYYLGSFNNIDIEFELFKIIDFIVEEESSCNKNVYYDLMFYESLKRRN